MPASPPETRASLILRLQNADDVAAWDEFVRLYGPVIYRAARARDLQPADAENLVQQVLLRVAQSVTRWLERSERGPFRAWLLTIARNEAVNMLTLQATRPLGEDGDELRKRAKNHETARERRAMTETRTQCDDHQLLAMLRADGNLPSQQSIVEHIEGCERCQVRLAELAAGKDQWQKVARALSDHDANDDSLDFELEQNVIPRLAHLCDRSDQWNKSMARQLLDPPSHPEMLGRLGRYEIERLIGSGGMGIVFKAHDTELNRPVAIKMLAPYLASSGSARKRFARAAAGIVDDYVVPIYNVEWERDPPFLVMQYVAGGSLQEKLDGNGPLEVTEIVRIGLQAAKGLSAAHHQGLIHRDVKPSNILLDEGVERALLTDFGLARTEDDAQLTRSGFQPGTPHYMSPEQVRGESIDGRSDLFGLGCVMYALCTGRPPFRADTGYAVLRRITDDAPRSIREVNPDIPDWLEQIVMKLLEKDRHQRYQSAEEIAETLSGWLAHLQQPNTIPAPAVLAASSSSNQRNGRGAMAYLLGAAASLLLLFAGIMIVLETAKGTIRIESDLDGVPIRITQGDKVVESLTVTRDGASIRVAAGDYVVEVGEGIDDIQVEGSTVSLARRGSEVVRITQVQKNLHVESMESESALLAPNDDNASSSQAKFGGIRITDKMCRIIGESTSVGRLAIYAGDANSDAKHLVGVLAPAGFFEVEFRPVLPSDAIDVEMESIRMAVVTEEGEVRERVISTQQLAKRGVKSGRLKIRHAFGDESPVRSTERVHFADLHFDDQSKLPVFLAFQSLGEVESDSRGETSFEERLQGKWQLVRQVSDDGDTQAIPRNAVCEIKGNQLFHFEDSNAKKYATFSIDESKSPIHIDLKIDGDTKAGRGLVALENARLTLCLTDLDSPDAPRPTVLEPTRGYWYMEYVRPKAGATERGKPRLPMSSIASLPGHGASPFSRDAGGERDGTNNDLDAALRDVSQVISVLSHRGLGSELRVAQAKLENAKAKQTLLSELPRSYSSANDGVQEQANAELRIGQLKLYSAIQSTLPVIKARHDHERQHQIDDVLKRLIRLEKWCETALSGFRPAFGKPQRGLRLGLVAYDGVRVFHQGDWAAFEYYLENTTGDTLEVEIFPTSTVGQVLEVINAKGALARIPGESVSYEQEPIRITLKPHGVFFAGVEGFQVGKRADGKTLGPLWQDPIPGQYTARLPLPIHITGTKNERTSLVSGRTSFEIAESADPVEIATLIETLADLDSAKREAASTRLREIYIAPSRTTWDKRIERIRNGDQKTSILRRFGIDSAQAEVVMGTGPYLIESYRLDSRWVFTGTFLNESQGRRANTLHSNASISEAWQTVSVEPPANYSGKWTTYYANGQPHRDRHFEGGRPTGTWTSYNPDGSVQTTRNHSSTVGNAKPHETGPQQSEPSNDSSSPPAQTSDARAEQVFSHSSGVQAATFSPDGHKLATGSDNNTLQVTPFSGDAGGTEDGNSVEKLLDGVPLTVDGLAVLQRRLTGAEVELVHEIRTEDNTYTASYLIQYR
ncbi:MAG: protein kinase, partial [Planctomycetales bacterium]|nr:protein kinase [Planctomycetales bacterium]